MKKSTKIIIILVSILVLLVLNFINIVKTIPANLQIPFSIANIACGITLLFMEAFG